MYIPIKTEVITSAGVSSEPLVPSLIFTPIVKGIHLQLSLLLSMEFSLQLLQIQQGSLAEIESLALLRTLQFPRLFPSECSQGMLLRPHGHGLHTEWPTAASTGQRPWSPGATSRPPFLSYSSISPLLPLSLFLFLLPTTWLTSCFSLSLLSSLSLSKNFLMQLEGNWKASHEIPGWKKTSGSSSHHRQTLNLICSWSEM